mmetsp:Transcript_20521/g.29424  ORF Transcript_20521/g.29424 Transcript_20521/m.29424 type:complete len:84 (+) Transcript_20521:346-597(+)
MLDHNHAFDSNIHPATPSNHRGIRPRSHPVRSSHTAASNYNPDIQLATPINSQRREYHLADQGNTSTAEHNQTRMSDHLRRTI